MSDKEVGLRSIVGINRLFHVANIEWPFALLAASWRCGRQHIVYR